MRNNRKPFRVLDLFAGCGGFSRGFNRIEGFDVVLANDIWEDALSTYKLNHPATTIIQGDITNHEVQERLLSEASNTGIDVIIGGPPCQAYSNSGYRDPNDPRGKLFEEYVRIVDHLRPAVFVMENVLGIKSMKHVPEELPKKIQMKIRAAAERMREYKELDRKRRQRKLEKSLEGKFQKLKKNITADRDLIQKHQVPVLDLVKNSFKQIGYEVEHKVLNAAEFGVPQVRKRVIIIGTRDNIPIKYPVVTHGELSVQKTVKEAIDDLKDLPRGTLPNHDYTAHKPSFVKRLEKTPVGGNVYSNFSDAWWRCEPDKPARTVKENHGGVHVHYEKPRVLTPRELARLQSFNDNFIFKGTKSSVLKQIGNAVPPKLSEAIATSVLEMLEHIN